MAIKIGIAPDSWGVWFPASDPNNAKQPQWWRCLDEMKVAGYEGSDAHEAVDALLDARATARAEKNWAVADAVRDGLTGLGFTIEDTPQGARVSYDPSEGK